MAHPQGGMLPTCAGVRRAPRRAHTRGVWQLPRADSMWRCTKLQRTGTAVLIITRCPRRISRCSTLDMGGSPLPGVFCPYARSMQHKAACTAGRSTAVLRLAKQWVNAAPADRPTRLKRAGGHSHRCRNPRCSSKRCSRTRSSADACSGSRWRGRCPQTTSMHPPDGSNSACPPLQAAQHDPSFTPETEAGGSRGRTRVGLGGGGGEHGLVVDEAVAGVAGDERAAGLDELRKIAAREDDVHVQVLRLGLVDVRAAGRERLAVVCVRRLERLVLHTRACTPGHGTGTGGDKRTSEQLRGRQRHVYRRRECNASGACIRGTAEASGYIG